MRILALLLVVGSLAACTTTDTCAGIDAVHEAFLEEVRLDPNAYDAATIRNERLSYAAAKAACVVFNRKNPTVKAGG